jgi:hypothetical protein
MDFTIDALGKFTVTLNGVTIAGCDKDADWYVDSWIKMLQMDLLLH